MIQKNTICTVSHINFVNARKLIFTSCFSYAQESINGICWNFFILLQHILNEKRRHTIDHSKNSICWIQKYICIPFFHSIGGRIH